MNDQGLTLLQELFNAFEQSEDGIYLFADGGDGDLIPVSDDTQTTLEEIARLLYEKDTNGFEEFVVEVE